MQVIAAQVLERQLRPQHLCMATATPPIVPAHDEVLILAFTPSSAIAQPLHLLCNSLG